MRRLSLRAAWLGALLLGGGAAAQAPDSARAAPPLALPEAPQGQRLAPVPAVTAALGIEALFLGAAHGGAALAPGAAGPSAPAAFVYTLAAPGRAGGVAWDGLDPAAASLTLDGRSLDDLLTGAPRYDLLPAEALGPTVSVATRRGAPLGVEATVRTFRLARPVTELRYHAGREGIQLASGTHAQTRRAPAFLGGGSPDARLTASLHVATRNSTGPLTAGQQQHTHATGRVLLTRPGLALDAGVFYADRTDGARRGLVAATFADVFTSAAQPLGPAATRRTQRAEAWATARLRVLAQPATITASVVRQRLVYSPVPTDTLETWITAQTLAFVQPLGRGPTLRLTAIREGDPTGGSDPLGDPGARLQLHAEALDTLALAGARVALAAGGHAAGTHAFPTASAEAMRGRARVGVRLAGRVPSRIEAVGLAGFVEASAERRVAPTVLVDGSVWTAPRALTLGVRAVAHRRWRAPLLVARGDTLAAWETAESPLDYAAVTLAARWREAARRGLYARAETTAGGSLRPGASPLHRREAASLPRVHATLRVGTRATNVRNVVDLDLAAIGRAWTGFRSRVVEPATGLLALPDPDAALGYLVPARGTLGLVATATFRHRATVVLALDHVGAQVAPALVVPGEPLPGPTLRFGVFWALLD